MWESPRAISKGLWASGGKPDFGFPGLSTARHFRRPFVQPDLRLVRGAGECGDAVGFFCPDPQFPPVFPAEAMSVTVEPAQLNRAIVNLHPAFIGGFEANRFAPEDFADKR